jgi:drug/metabolite transporter (DMT)-like permease
VSLAAVVLVLVAAGMHVGWNAVVKTSGDPLRVTARAVWLGTLAWAPLFGLAWVVTGCPLLSPEGWLLAAISSVLEVAYWVALALAYRRGGLSSVYPLARGTGAFLGALIGIGLLGEQLGPRSLVGVGLLLAGTLTVAASTARRDVLVPALGTGALIAAYTFVDRLGARTGPAWLYGCLLFVGGSVLLVPVLRWAPRMIRGPDPVPGSADDPGWRAPLAVGVLMVTAYVMVLTALAVAPLAGVAPLRESATVLAAGWGVLILHERERAAWRLAGAGCVAAGSILLALGG